MNRQIEQIQDELPEIALEHNHSSNLERVLHNELKIQKSQSDLSKMHQMQQYRETKKLQDTMNFVDQVLKLYTKRSGNQSTINQVTYNQPMMSRFNSTSNQSPQITRRMSREINTSSLERHIQLKQDTSIVCHPKKSKHNSEFDVSRRLLTNNNNNNNNDRNFFGKQWIDGNHKSYLYNSSNSLFKPNKSMANSQESLKQFATRHINQSSSLIRNNNSLREIRAMKLNPSQKEVITLSKIFSQKSPLLTPMKSSDQSFPRIPQAASQQQHYSNSLNDSAQYSKSKKATKYTTYIQNSQLALRKKALLSKTFRDVMNNTNGNSANHSIDMVKFSTEASSPSNKKFNVLFKKIF